ncbi:unnamed protein product [Burkholderia pseudomallei]|nr:unnamed protein product [Burkholderia pseudomallei]
MFGARRGAVASAPARRRVAAGPEPGSLAPRGCEGAVVGVSNGEPTDVSFAAWPMRSRPPATPSRKGAKRGREARTRTLPRRRERGAGGRNP